MDTYPQKHLNPDSQDFMKVIGFLKDLVDTRRVVLSA